MFGVGVTSGACGEGGDKEPVKHKPDHLLSSKNKNIPKEEKTIAEGDPKLLVVFPILPRQTEK